MPIDTSMYNNNPWQGFAQALGSVMQAKSMSDLGKIREVEAKQAQQQFGDDQAVRNAVKSNTVVDPNTGATSINHAGVMANLGKSDNPMLAQKYNLQVQQQSADQLSRQMALGKQIAWSVPTGPNATPQQKQEAWDKATAQAMSLNLPGAAQQPRQYPGDQYVQGLQLSYLSPEEKINLHKDEIANKLKQQEADAATLKSQAEAANAGIPYGGKSGGASAPSNMVASNGKGIPGKPGELSDIDPADLLKRVPMKDRDKVAAEIDAAKNAVQNGPKILEHFDNAYDKTHFVNLLPGVENADQKAYEALMGPTFKDVEGTVRQAAMDNMFKNTMPAPVRDRLEADARDTKRSAVTDYLKYKSSAALSKTYGIDLSKYKSTNVQAALGAGNDKKDPGKSGGKVMSFDEWKASQK